VELGELSLDELRQFGGEFGEDFYEAVTPQATLDCHDVLGGTATHRVKTALIEAADRVAALKTGAPEVVHAGA
jgi:argininosuccinate lyase